MNDGAPGTPRSIADHQVDFAGINALSSRPAGYAVALKCLQVQADAEDADPSLRAEKRASLHPDAWSWYQGALGEIEVGKFLGALGPEWFVRHSVPIGADTKDVDHLVIGPGGVFAINTKHHAGASIWIGDHVLRVNNANTHHLKAAQGDSLDVSRRLSGKVGFPVPVTPVIAVLDSRAIKDGRAGLNRSVSVLDARNVVAWLIAQPAQVSQTKIELIKLAAEEPMTWHVDPRAADTLRVMQRFERLAARVTISRPEPQPRAAPNTTRRQTRQTTATTTASRRSAFPEMVRLWCATAFVVIAILVFRGIANQPCLSPASCLLPSVYLAWKPLLMLLGIVAVGRAGFRTVRLQSTRSSVARRRK
ncbi:MAG: nuclease-related domain-containing protein [Leifsonia sp.]